MSTTAPTLSDYLAAQTDSKADLAEHLGIIVRSTARAIVVGRSYQDPTASLNALLHAAAQMLASVELATDYPGGHATLLDIERHMPDHLATRSGLLAEAMREEAVRVALADADALV